MMTKKAAKPQSGEMVMLPLGGAGEIGMNMYVYGFGKGRKKQWLVVDCGVKFGDERDPGIDVILPDTQFLEADRKHGVGIVLTHAHEDHLGGVAWLWQRLKLPVYCTPFAAELLKRKLSEAGILGEVKLHVLPMGARFEVGKFDVEFVSVTHSIPEPNAVVLRTEAGTVVHSGDWKIDRKPTILPEMDEVRLREIGDEGVDALICDSTNVLREGMSPSEDDICTVLAEIIAQAKKRVAVTTFASHVGRLTSIIKAARMAGREVVLAGRAMRNVTLAAREVGLLGEAGELLDEDAFGYLPRDKVLLLCTGSQGEQRAAMARIANGIHPNIELDQGDLVIMSSKTIPGNEKSVAEVLNNLAVQGVETITSDDALVHTSGHPRQGELKEMYNWLRPKALVPMHGEMRHLMAHASFAKASGIGQTQLVKNGDMVRLCPGDLELVDEVHSGRLHVDGRIIINSTDEPVRKRRKLAFSGVAFVSLSLDERGEVMTDPQVTLDGIPQVDEKGAVMQEMLEDIVDDVLDAMPRKKRKIDNAVIDVVRNAVRREADKIWGKRPVCHVQVHRV